MNHDVEPGAEFTADLSVSEAEVGDYYALVIPGGTTNADSLRLEKAAVEFVKGFVDARKTVAAICHGPWMLVEAGVLKGKTLTSYPSLRPTSRTPAARGGMNRRTDVRRTAGR